jgi:hypothetical protein
VVVRCGAWRKQPTGHACDRELHEAEKDEWREREAGLAGCVLLEQRFRPNPV